MTNRHLDLSFEEPEGQVSDQKDDKLLLMDIPKELWPYLNGLPHQVTVFNSLSSTLVGLGMPEEIWPLASTSVQPTLLRLKSTV